MFGPKKLRSKNIFGPIKLWVQKSFVYKWSKKVAQDFFGPEKIFMTQKDFGPKQNFWPKKILGPKKFGLKEIVGPKKMWGLKWF